MLNPDLSVVVPAYNEAGNIIPLVEAIHTHLRPLDIPYEIIIVDDGSADTTWQEIRDSSAKSPELKGIKLARNFGHQPALIAGLTYASGKAVISMDGDMQHPPSLLPDLVQAWRDGNQIVTTQRIDGVVTSGFKKTTSKLFYKVFSWLTDIPLSEGSSDFRLMDRCALDQLLKFQDNPIFIRGAVEWLGFQSVTIPYELEARHAGVSKYNLGKMIAFATNAILSFSAKPLRISVWIGFLTAFGAFAELMYILWAYMHGITVPGWASMLGVMSFLMGILFIILGIIGAYIARLYIVLLGRPLFIVAEQANYSDQESDP